MEANGRRGRGERGYSFVELLIVSVILLVLGCFRHQVLAKRD